MRILVALTLVLASCSCDESAGTSSTTQATGAGGAGAGGAGGTGPSMTCAPATTGTGGTAGAGAYVPGQDSTYTQACWAPGCPLLIADEPQKAVPPLEWVTCGTACERIAINWPTIFNQATTAPQVRSDSGGYTIGIAQAWEFDTRSVVFDPSGIPIHVLKIATGDCQTSIPDPQASGLWFAVYTNGAGWRHIFEPWDGLGSSVTSLSVSFAAEGSGEGSDSLLALRGNFGASASVFDRTNGTTSVLAAPDVIGALLPQPLEDKAFTLGIWAYNRTEVWAWSRNEGWAELIDKTPKDVVDVRAANDTLYWIESPARADPDNDPWAPGTLYSSPLTTTAAEVVATPIRNMLAIGPGTTSAIGGGYYAVYSGYDDKVQIVRLSDGYGWIVTPAELQEFRTISHIDEDYLVYRTTSMVVRVPLAELGPPSPP